MNDNASAESAFRSLAAGIVVGNILHRKAPRWHGLHLPAEVKRLTIAQAASRQVDAATARSRYAPSAIADPAKLVRADGSPQQQRYKPRQRSSDYRDHEIGCLG